MKIAMALDENLGVGYLANAAACIVSGLFHNEKGLIGDSADGIDCAFIPITKIPILIFKKSNKDWKELLKRAKRNKLKYIVFTREAQSTTSYDEYISRVKGKPLHELNVIGIGVLGQENLVNSFAGDLALLR